LHKYIAGTLYFSKRISVSFSRFSSVFHCARAKNTGGTGRGRDRKPANPPKNRRHGVAISVWQIVRPAAAAAAAAAEVAAAKVELVTHRAFRHHERVVARLGAELVGVCVVQQLLVEVPVVD